MECREILIHKEREKFLVRLLVLVHASFLFWNAQVESSLDLQELNHARISERAHFAVKPFSVVVESPVTDEVDRRVEGVMHAVRRSG